MQPAQCVHAGILLSAAENGLLCAVAPGLRDEDPDEPARSQQVLAKRGRSPKQGTESEQRWPHAGFNSKSAWANLPLWQLRRHGA